MLLTEVPTDHREICLRNYPSLFARLAQSGRAAGLHPACRGFKSLILHHMKRENRYIVIKRADVEKYCNKNQKRVLGNICQTVIDSRAHKDNPDPQFVVVKSTWPMYEDTWDAIEAFENDID